MSASHSCDEVASLCTSNMGIGQENRVKL